MFSYPVLKQRQITVISRFLSQQQKKNHIREYDYVNRRIRPICQVDSDSVAVETGDLNASLDGHFSVYDERSSPDIYPVTCIDVGSE